MALFSSISKKIVSKSMEKQFVTFLNNIEENLNEDVVNRAARRKSGNTLNKLLGNTEMTKLIKAAYIDKTPLINDNQYKHLLYTLVYFYNTGFVKDELFFEVILKPFIACTKSCNYNTRFTNYFNDSIEPTLDTVLDLKNYVISIAQGYKEINPESDYKGFINSIVPEDLVARIEGIKNAEDARKSQLKFERNLAKRKEKRTQELKELTEVKETVPTLKHETPKVQSKLEILYKQGDLDELFDSIKDINELKELKLDKTKFMSIVFDYNVYRIKKIIGIDLFNNLQNCINKSNDAKVEFYKLVKQFNNMKHSEVKVAVERIINPNLTSNTMVANYIIFPSEEFINNESYDLTKLNKFKTSNPKLIDLKDISNKELAVSNNKAYISYLGDAMICLFNLNICDENRKVLGENTNILLILGINNNDDVINESIDFVYKNYLLIDEIINIFSNPFTADTLERAKELISISNNVIEEKNSSEKKKKKKM